MTTTELTWQDIPKKLRDKISVTARRGAKLLDKEMPGWYDKIDVGRLDMKHGCQCIYGQLRAESVFLDKLYVPYEEREYFFGYDLHKDAWTWAEDKSEGSYLYERELQDLARNWLQEEWLREIYTRREADRSAAEGEQV